MTRLPPMNAAWPAQRPAAVRSSDAASVGCAC